MTDITRINLSKYYEIRKGWHEVFLMREDKDREIAYSEDEYAFIGIGYSDEDREAVEEFADLYDLEIIA